MSRRTILPNQPAPTRRASSEISNASRCTEREAKIMPVQVNIGSIGSMVVHYHHHPQSGAGSQIQISRRHLTRVHEHTRIRKTDDITIYRCSECKELGNKDRYVCLQCPSYVQHINCKDYKERATHPLFKTSTFKLHEQHSHAIRASCNACGLDIGQFFYHCERTYRVMHPFCLKNLACSIYISERNYNLCRTIKSKVCSHCLSMRKDNKDNCWWYSSERQDSQYHVSCMMKIFRKRLQ